MDSDEIIKNKNAIIQSQNRKIKDLNNQIEQLSCFIQKKLIESLLDEIDYLKSKLYEEKRKVKELSILVKVGDKDNE